MLAGSLAQGVAGDHWSHLAAMKLEIIVAALGAGDVMVALSEAFELGNAIPNTHPLAQRIARRAIARSDVGSRKANNRKSADGPQARAAYEKALADGVKPREARSRVASDFNLTPSQGATEMARRDARDRSEEDHALAAISYHMGNPGGSQCRRAPCSPHRPLRQTKNSGMMATSLDS